MSTGALWSRGAAQLPRSSSCSYNCASCGCHGPCFLPKEEGGRLFTLAAAGALRLSSAPSSAGGPRCPPAAAPQPGESSRLPSLFVPAFFAALP